MTTSEIANTLSSEAEAPPRASWLRTGLVIVVVLLVASLLVVSALHGLAADPMAGT